MTRTDAFPARTHLAVTLRSLRERAAEQPVQQKHVAELLRCSQSTLSEIESGKKAAGIRIVRGYGQLFGGIEMLEALWEAAQEEMKAHRSRRNLQHASDPAQVAVWTAPAGDCSVPGDKTEWIRAVNPPSGDFVRPREPFTQGWVVRNAGIVPWRGRWLARVGPPAGAEVPWSHRRVRIRDTDPGEEVLIAMPIRGAEIEGTITVHFKQVDGLNRMYFPHIPWGVSVTVVTTLRPPPPLAAG